MMQLSKIGEARLVLNEASGPICVDLDGTLTLSDSLVEGLLGLLRGVAVFGAVHAMLVGGRSRLKSFVAQAVPFDPSLLPYNPLVLAYLQAARSEGRHIVLVTAADVAVARAISSHLGLFDEVMASDGTVNLKGRAKAEALVRRFGRHGFTYVGNDSSDLDVWREAKSAVIVNASMRVAKSARAITIVEAEFPSQDMAWAGLLRALRPYQWVKNLLVFIPLFTAHQLASATAWFFAIGTFAAFCVTASAIYVLNDLTDLPADRRHPRKRLRPFASGVLSPKQGLFAALILLCIGGGIGFLSKALPILLLYASLSIGYSLRLKELPLVDVFVLAGLYTVRIFAGALAIGQPLSLWLLGFSAFLFFSLALVKRIEELRGVNERGGGWLARRGYAPSDIDILQNLGVASSFAAAIVLALFVQSEASAVRYASPELLWAIVPLVLFWQCRIWLSTARGYMHDDPIVYASRDWVSWLVAASAFVILALAQSLEGIVPLSER